VSPDSQNQTPKGGVTCLDSSDHGKLENGLSRVVAY
jgi:hypothetical protein